MCSRRRDLFQAHLLLAKHFHPHLNLSVSSLSASSLSMCVAYNAVCLCVWEWFIIMTYMQYICESFWYFPSSLLPHCLFSVLLSTFPQYLPVVKQANTLCSSSNNDSIWTRGLNDEPEEPGVSMRCAFQISERCSQYSSCYKVVVRWWNNHFLSSCTWEIFLEKAIKWIPASK